MGQNVSTKKENYARTGDRVKNITILVLLIVVILYC